MDLGLADRTILITGASRGIGRAIAQSFAAEGCRLRLVARDGDRLAAARDALVRDHGVEVELLAVDLAERGSAEAISEKWPDVDVVINNAGAISRGSLGDIDEAGWRHAWDLKVFGYINMTREYYRRMCERRRGVILNVIGLAAEKLDYAYVAGSAGNAALVAFTRAVGSMSLDFGVRVLGVNPGWVETERSMRSLRGRSRELFGDEERWRELIVDWPAGRLIAATEIADVVVFLASDRAGSVCGQVVTIDGGFGARSYPSLGEGRKAVS